MEAMWVAVSAIIIAIVGGGVQIIMLNINTKAAREAREAASKDAAALLEMTTINAKDTKVGLEAIQKATDGSYSEVLKQLKTANEQVGRVGQIEAQLTDIASRLPETSHNDPQVTAMLAEIHKAIVNNSVKRR